MKNNMNKIIHFDIPIFQNSCRALLAYKTNLGAQFYELKLCKKRFIKNKFIISTPKCRKSPADRLTDWMLRAIRERIGLYFPQGQFLPSSEE
jgi:hypothetical protein